MLVSIAVDSKVFRQVPLYLGLFCSSDGDLISIRRGYVQPLIKTLAANGYHVVNTNRKVEYVHRLVALTFLGPPEEGEEVNHKNSDRLDNCVTNLEWVSHAVNSFHGSNVGKGSKYKQPIMGVSKVDGSTVKYGSLMEAERSGFRQSCISMCLAGKSKSHKGYTWKRINDS